MKHLKRFNESNEISDIEDILLELKDMGAEIEIVKGTYKYARIYFDNGVYWKDIKDCILRLKCYLGDDYDFCFYRLEPRGIEKGNHYVDLDEDTNITNKIYFLNIGWKDNRKYNEWERRYSREW